MKRVWLVFLILACVLSGCAGRQVIRTEAGIASNMMPKFDIQIHDSDLKYIGELKVDRTGDAGKVSGYPRKEEYFVYAKSAHGMVEKMVVVVNTRIFANRVYFKSNVFGGIPNIQSLHREKIGEKSIRSCFIKLYGAIPEVEKILLEKSLLMDSVYDVNILGQVFGAGNSGVMHVYYYEKTNDIDSDIDVKSFIKRREKEFTISF